MTELGRFAARSWTQADDDKLRALALAGASTRAKGSPILADVMEPSIKERLWHKMRADLAQFVPETSENDLLMCCACGRSLRQEHFHLEHFGPATSPAIRSFRGPKQSCYTRQRALREPSAVQEAL